MMLTLEDTRLMYTCVKFECQMQLLKNTDIKIES